MTCRELIEFLMDYLDGELGPEERARFDAHLAECPMCVAYLETYQQAVRLGKAVLAPPGEEVPAEVPDDLVRAVLAARGG
jgi:anti-sigma factor RsiW